MIQNALETKSAYQYEACCDGGSAHDHGFLYEFQYLGIRFVSALQKNRFEPAQPMSAIIQISLSSPYKAATE